MVLSRTDENELLTALHAALFDQDGWTPFLARLRARTEADLCRMLLSSGDGHWREVAAVRARQPDAAALVPAVFACDALRPGRVYAQDELADADGAVLPEGLSRHIRIDSPGGSALILSVHAVSEDFRARDAALLASLAPHLIIALRAQEAVEREQRRSTVAGAALGRLAVAWVLLDARGRVLDADPAALRLMEDGRLMRRAGDGRLRCPHSEAEALLESAVPDPGAEPRAAWLGIDPPVQMLVMRPPLVVAETLPDACCLLLVRDGSPAAMGNGRNLVPLYQLNRSEAALAAHIADGDSLAEAADRLGLTIETARNYSKRIYAKTGARGQADLVRILLNGVGSLGA